MDLPARGAGETILVVEDDPTVRTTTCKVLAEYGYRVLEAADGALAFDLVRAHDAPIQLLLTDVVMPNCSGPELVRRLATSGQPLDVIYMSGHADDVIARHTGPLETAQIIRKPFTWKGILARVRDVLDKKPAAIAATR